MTREELFNQHDDSICQLCISNGHYKSTPYGECEGSWCEESQDLYAEQNGIELIN